MNQNSNASFTRSGFNSTRSLNISSTDQPEIRNKNKAYDLRQVLKDKMVEYGTLQSQWTTEETKLRSQIDDYVSQLRDLSNQEIAEIQKEKQSHFVELEQLKNQHQLNILELQTQFNDGLSESEMGDNFEELDNEIETLKDAISRLENAPPPSGDIEEGDEDAEERIRTLEERLDEIRQMHDEALRQREEDSKASTQMIEQLILKNQDDEQDCKAEIERLVGELNNIDKQHAAQIEEIRNELFDIKKSNSVTLRNSILRINQIQTNITKKQRIHHKSIQALHDEIDHLRSNLESLTTRQRQQMKEASNAARVYADEKRKFVSFHRELEMLNSELVRESVEHETLMKELNKMDSLILSQMSAVGSNTSSSTYYKNSRF